MSSVNRVHIVGRLGNDPELKYTTNGDPIANLSVATSEKYKDKSGQQVEHTEWHRVSFFGRTAEVCGQYLTKGSLVYVEGSLRTRKWQDKDGNDRYTTEIKGERMQMLGGRSDDDRPGDRNSDRPRREEPRRERDEPRREEPRRPASRQETDDYRNASGSSPRRGGSSGFDDMDDDIPF